MRMYAVRDSKTGSFLAPFLSRTHGEAERELQTVVNEQQQSNVSKYPEDYDLFWIAEWDECRGVLAPRPAPEHIVKAVQLRKAGLERAAASMQ